MDMEMRRKQPIGVELVKRGIVQEADIENALQYQREHPSKKIGDILYILGVCDPKTLIDAIADILGEKGVILNQSTIKIKLTGDLSKNYDIYYRVHVEELGWMDWASNGEAAGTAGYSYRIEAMQIELVEKGGKAPGDTTRPFIQHYISYKTHVQDYGWLGKVYDGNLSGITNRAKQLEAIAITLEGAQYSGNIEYRTHVEDIGWQSWKSNGTIAGTTGKSKQIEAIKINIIEK